MNAWDYIVLGWAALGVVVAIVMVGKPKSTGTYSAGLALWNLTYLVLLWMAVAS